MIRKKAKIKRDQAVCDDMTVTLGRRCNNLNNTVKNSYKHGLKTAVKKQNILLQKTMLGILMLEAQEDLDQINKFL